MLEAFGGSRLPPFGEDFPAWHSPEPKKYTFRLQLAFNFSTRHSGASGAIETAPLESRQWEKPELVGEDAREEMEAGERTGAELPEEEARMEMGAADLRQMIVHELHG